LKLQTGSVAESAGFLKLPFCGSNCGALRRAPRPRSPEIGNLRHLRNQMSAWNSRYLSIDGGKQDVADSGAIGGYLGAATGQAGIARVIETGSRQCRPLAVSVNRDERSTASRPRTLSLQNLSSQLRAHRTLGSRTMVTPKRTSHPSGSRPARLAARGPWLRLQPQKTLCSPPRPFLAAGLASRTALWLHRSVIQHLVAHGTGATNS